MRQVTPLECPECAALWLFWPKEQSGMNVDSLNLRSANSCSYCEKAKYYNLRMFGNHPHLPPEDESSGPRCDLPAQLGKPNWACTRREGHEGPCAAKPIGLLHKLYWAARLRWGSK